MLDAADEEINRPARQVFSFEPNLNFHRDHLLTLEQRPPRILTPLVGWSPRSSWMYPRMENQSKS